MIELEKKALEALESVSMQLGSSGKRFRGDMVYSLRVDPDFKMTARQALYLWKLVHMYRRQIRDQELLRHAAITKLTDALPDIYLTGDHRPAIAPGFKKEKAARPPKQEPAAEAAAINSSQGNLFQEGSVA